MKLDRTILVSDAQKKALQIPACKQAVDIVCESYDTTMENGIIKLEAVQLPKTKDFCKALAKQFLRHGKLDTKRDAAIACTFSATKTFDFFSEKVSEKLAEAAK